MHQDASPSARTRNQKVASRDFLDGVAKKRRYEKKAKKESSLPSMSFAPLYSNMIFVQEVTLRYVDIGDGWDANGNYLPDDALFWLLCFVVFPVSLV